MGGGLAGSEAAWALAERGVAVRLSEMRPVRMTAAHRTDRLAELVCSNSFKSVEPTNAHGLAPATLTPHLATRDDPLVLFAGQLTGVEGYTESVATGMVAGINLARLLAGERPLVPPPTTMLGALYRYLREADPAHFQPMNANFGLLEPLDPPVKDKARKKERLVARALAEIDAFAARLALPVPA